VEVHKSLTIQKICILPIVLFKAEEFLVCWHCYKNAICCNLINSLQVCAALELKNLFNFNHTLWNYTPLEMVCKEWQIRLVLEIDSTQWASDIYTLKLYCSSNNNANGCNTRRLGLFCSVAIFSTVKGFLISVNEVWNIYLLHIVLLWREMYVNSYDSSSLSIHHTCHIALTK
jgi:hypothetical protein